MSTRPADSPPVATTVESEHAAGRESLKRALIVLAAASAAIAGLVAVFNARIGSFILDETLIKQSAVSYTSGLPGSLLDDPNARATSRLYPLVISPLFALFDGDQAVRAARSLNAWLFVSAAVPCTLLAREVVARWSLAVFCGLACVTVPWLTLTTAMFSESLSYLAVVTAVLAMYWAFLRPAWWRDGLVILALVAAVTSRTQLVGLAFGYGLAILARGWLDRRCLGGWTSWGRRMVLRYPFTIAIALLIVGFALHGAYSDTLRADLRSLLGMYAQAASERASVPTNVGSELALQGLALSLGVGIVPALLSLVWYPRALMGQAGERARALALVVGVGLGSLLAATVYAQGGSWGAATEERYYIYLAPFLWIGAVAAVDRRWARATKGLAVAGGLIVIVALLVALPRGLDAESSFFAPAMAVTNYVASEVTRALSDVTGLGGAGAQDLVAVGVAAVVALAWLLCRRQGRGPLAALAVGLALQLVVTGTAFIAIAGGIDGIRGRTIAAGEFRGLGFVDRAANGRQVTWIANQVDAVPQQADAIQRTALIYNDDIRRRLAVPSSGAKPDNFPLNSLPVSTATPAGGDAAGSAPLGRPVPLAVQTINSPFVQVAGERIATSPSWERLELLGIAGAPRAVWASSGLGPDAVARPAAAVRFRAWSPGRVRFRLRAVAGPATVTISLGATTRAVVLGPGDTGQIVIRSCAGRVEGGLLTSAPVEVAAVTLDRADCG